MAKKKFKKIVIIGSNSFSAGSLISLLLRKNFKVYGISRSNLNKKKFLRFYPKNKNFRFKKFDLNKNHREIINLIKNLSWHIPDQEKNIEYNLKYIRNMKKIVSMFIIISLMCAPIVMLMGLCCIPPEINNSLRPYVKYLSPCSFV